MTAQDLRGRAKFHFRRLQSGACGAKVLVHEQSARRNQALIRRIGSKRMLGRMQEWPLLMHKVIDFAAIQFPEQEVGVADGRRADACHELSRHSPAGAESRQKARPRRYQDRRPGRDARLERLSASRKLVRHRRRRRGLPYRQSAPLPRADRLDHERRRRPDGADRSHLRAAPGGDRRPLADGRALRRSHRRRAHAGDQTQERRRLRGLDRRGRQRLSPGRNSTSAPPPASATPPAPPAIPRACSIPIARTSCIR